MWTRRLEPVTECDPSSQRGPVQSRPIYPRYNDKQLTSAISKATTAEYLLQLACAYKGSLNPIHVAAFITKLATINKQYPEQAPSSKPELAVRSAIARQQLLHKLQQKLREQECQGQTIRGLANIIWALAKLPYKPDPKLLHMLIRNFYSQLPSAVPQDISNVLWGVAELTRRACTITQTGPTHPTSPSSRAAPPSTSSSTTRCSKERQIGATPPNETTAAPAHQSVDEGMATTQHDDRLSQYKHLLEQQESAAQSTTSACDDADLAAADSCTCSSCHQQLPHQPASKHLLSLVQVHHLLQQLCELLDTTEPQTIGNVSWALTVLQKCNRWCMCPCLPQVRAIMLAFTDCVQEALPDAMQRVVHCMSGLAAACTNHAGQSWISWQPPLLSTLMSALLSQQKLQQHIVLSVLKDVAQVGYLFLPYDTVQQLSTRDPSSAAGVWRTADKNTKSSACGGAQEQAATDFQVEPLQLQLQQDRVDDVPVMTLQAGSSQRAHCDMAEAAGTSQHIDNKVWTRHNDSIQADHAAAGCMTADGDIEELADDPLTAAALKQLEGMGLLMHYKALRRRFTSGRIPNMRHLEGHQVAAAALPDDQLQYKPPTAEVLEQRTSSPQRCQLQQQQDGSKSGAIHSGSVSTKCGQPRGVGRHSWAPQKLHSYHMPDISDRLMPYMRRIAYAPVAIEPPWVAPPQPQPSPLVASRSGSWQGMYPQQQQPPSWQHSQGLYQQQQQQQNPWQHGQGRPQNGHSYAWGSHQLGHPQQEDELPRPEQQQQQHSGDSNCYSNQQRYTEQQHQQPGDLGDQNHQQHQLQQQLNHTRQLQISEPVSLETAVQESPFAAAVTNVGAAAHDGQDNFAKGQSTYEVLASTTESTFSPPAIIHRPLGIHGISSAAGASDTFRSGSSSQQSVPAAPGFGLAVGRMAASNATPPTQGPIGTKPAPPANLSLKTAPSGSSSSLIALQLLARQASNGLGSQLGLMETAAGSAVSASRAGTSNQQTADQHAEVMKAGLKQLAVSSNPAAATAACVNDHDTRLLGVASGNQVVSSFEGKSFLDEAAAANVGTSSFQLGLKLNAAAVTMDSISNASSSVKGQQPTKPALTIYSHATRSQQQLQMSQQAQQQLQVHQRQPHPQQQQSLPRQLAYTAQELAAAELVHVQHAGGQVKSYRQMPDGLLIPVHVENAKQLQHQQHDSGHLTSTAGHAEIHNNTLQQLQQQQQPQQKLFEHSPAPDAWLMPQQQGQIHCQLHSQLQIRALSDVVDTSAPAASSTTAGISHETSASGLFPTAQGLLQPQQRFGAVANMGGAHDPSILLPRGVQQRQLRLQHFSGAQTAVAPVPGVSQHQQLQHQHQFLLSRSGQIQVVTEADLRTEVTTQQAPNAGYPSLLTNAAMPISCGTFMAAASPASVQNPQFTGGVLHCAGMQQHALQSSMFGQLGMSALAGPSTQLVQLPDTAPDVLGHDQAPLGISWDHRITNTGLNAVPDHSLGLLGLRGDRALLQVSADHQQQQFVIQHQLPQGLTWPLGL